MDLRQQRIHFMGIGGIGMSALAELARARGAVVSGCDREAGPQTERLGAAGIPLVIGHDADHVREADLVVYTSAVPADHPERAAAHGKSMRRGAFLAALMQGARAVGICGTHGKTTTTAILAHLLTAAGQDPTVVLGGVSFCLDGNLRVGASGLFVSELDESDGSFLEPALDVAIVTNLESEHLRHYATFARLREAFARYAAGVAAAGLLVVGVDSLEAAALSADHAGRMIRFGLGNGADLQAMAIERSGGRQRFCLRYDNRDLGVFELPLPGQHNVLNALGALAVALHFDCDVEALRQSLAMCPGVARRLERVDAAAGVPIYSDYAHHPTEIQCAIAALRSLHAGPILVAFQPHLYSRTRDYAAAFGQALAAADEVLIADIYPAREEPIPGVSAALIVDAVRQAQGRAHGPFTLAELPAEIAARLAGVEAVVLMGAGSIDQVCVPCPTTAASQPVTRKPK